ncbi:hypothetical protein LXL04_017791 [Taraxacum kok-saghyz]
MPERNCPQTIKSFNALLGECVEGFFRELFEKLYLKPDIVSYNTAIKAFCDMGSFDSAATLFGEIEKNGMEPDLITFNTLLIGYYGNGRFLDGEKLWAKMMNTNLTPDIRTYSAKLVGLLCFCNNGDLTEAKNWYAKLGQSDSSTNKATFAALIRLACKLNDYDWSIEHFQQTIEEKCIVDRNVVQLMIDGLVKEKKIEIASSFHP